MVAIAVAANEQSRYRDWPSWWDRNGDADGFPKTCTLVILTIDKGIARCRL